MNIQLNFRSYKFYWLPRRVPLCVKGYGFNWLWFNLCIWKQFPSDDDMWEECDGY